ncbi:MAG: flavin-containing monooxygenase [Pseudomonadales bacterium]
MDTTITTKALIIGTGFSGICMAIKLKQAGIEDFVLLEKAEEVGGTWRENTYPGAECDIPSALYSYSFEHNAEWEFKWSEQQQIYDYQKHVAEKYELYRHIRFGEEVVTATFDEAAKRWTVSTGNGGVYDCQHLISAVGQLHRPFVPQYEGQESYQGISFHSANWDHNVDLTGKKVAVIGNAASAVQFIPQIAEQVSELTVFQRSANWVLPKQDRPYKPWEQWLSDKVPLITKLYRFKIWCRCDGLLYQIMKGNRLAARIAGHLSRRNMTRTIKDPILQRKLTPDYPIGAKRILFSDDYYEALSRENVSVETDAIARITATGITGVDGCHTEYDVIIYGTGFKSNPFLAPMQICGVGGQQLKEHWSKGAHAYLGMTTHGFPNLFMLYGPNTNLGHNSIILMIESQANYITGCITQMDKQGWSSIDIEEDAEDEFNTEIQQRLGKMAFSKVTASWYMDAGRITNNWAGTTLEYRRRTRTVDWENFQKAI